MIWQQVDINRKEWQRKILLFHSSTTVHKTGFMLFCLGLLLFLGFLLQPLKLNFNPQPSKLLQIKWNMRMNMEIWWIFTMLWIQHLLLTTVIAVSNTPQKNSENWTINRKRFKEKHINKYYDSSNNLSTFDFWLSQHNMKWVPHLTPQNRKYLFESVANLTDMWKGKPVELRIQSFQSANNHRLL